MQATAFVLMFAAFLFVVHGQVNAVCDPANRLQYPACVSVDAGSLGFKIPTLGDILTFAIRVLFVVAGLAALFYLLLGAFAWVTSGGDKDAVTAAREKIQAAVIGMILIVGVLAIIWTLEQVIFNRRICLGLSCPLTLPGLIEHQAGGELCCTCINPNGGGLCADGTAGTSGSGGRGGFGQCDGAITGSPVVINALDGTAQCAN